MERGLDTLKIRYQIYLIPEGKKRKKEAILKGNCGGVGDVLKFLDIPPIMGWSPLLLLNIHRCFEQRSEGKPPWYLVFSPPLAGSHELPYNKSSAVLKISYGGNFYEEGEWPGGGQPSGHLSQGTSLLDPPGQTRHQLSTTQ